MIFGILNPDLRKFEIKNLQICPSHLSHVAILPWEIQKVIFNSIIHTHTRRDALRTEVVVGASGCVLGCVGYGLERLEEDGESAPLSRLAAVDDHGNVVVAECVDVTPIILQPSHLSVTPTPSTTRQTPPPLLPPGKLL